MAAALIVAGDAGTRAVRDSNADTCPATLLGPGSTPQGCADQIDLDAIERQNQVGRQSAGC
jgi:hypothetical protein